MRQAQTMLLVHIPPPYCPCRTREGETDIYFSGLLTRAPELRMLRTQAGGELYIAVGHEVRQGAGS